MRALRQGEWNEGSTQEGREEGCESEEGCEDEETGEGSRAKEARERASHGQARGGAKPARQRRTDHVEFQAHRPSRARRLRRHGRRHVDPDRAGRPPHPLARARERAEEFHRRRRVRPAQAQGRRADRSAAGAHALELARDLRQHHGGRLPDPEDGPAARRLRAVRHFGAGKAAVDLVLRLLGRDLARRASALVLRRRIRAYARPARRTSRRRIRNDDQFYRCIDVRNPSKPVEVGRWWMPGTRARRQRARRRRGTRSTRATARTTPTFIPSAATAATSPISTAACSSSTSPTRRTRR